MKTSARKSKPPSKCDASETDHQTVSRSWLAQSTRLRDWGHPLADRAQFQQAPGLCPTDTQPSAPRRRELPLDSAAPCHRTADELLGRRKARAKSPPSCSLGFPHWTILIIESNPAVRVLAKWFFGSLGLQVTTIGNSHRARTKLTNHSFDVVLVGKSDAGFGWFLELHRRHDPSCTIRLIPVSNKPTWPRHPAPRLNVQLRSLLDVWEALNSRPITWPPRKKKTAARSPAAAETSIFGQNLSVTNYFSAP